MSKNADEQGGWRFGSKYAFMHEPFSKKTVQSPPRLDFSADTRYTVGVMKKKPVYLLLICILVLLIGCRYTGQPEATPAPQTDEPSPAPSAVTETVTLPSATPDPTLPPAPTPSPTPTPTPSPTPVPTPEPAFTMVWLSDTQNMISVLAMRENYLRMCDWIAEQADAGDICAVLHTGDMVDNGDLRGQWALFCDGIDRYRGKIPFLWAIGNHDEGFDFSGLWKKQAFVTELPREQIRSDCGACYFIRTFGGTELLFLSVTWSKTRNEGAVAWLKEVCDAHSDLPAVLLIHGYLTAEGTLMNRVAMLESELVAACPNIRLILSGHARGISHAAFSYDDDGDGEPDRTVYALMYDIQLDSLNYGYVCLLRYDPADNSLSVTSYSPLWDDYIYDDTHPELEQFVLHDVF